MLEMIFSFIPTQLGQGALGVFRFGSSHTCGPVSCCISNLKPTRDRPKEMRPGFAHPNNSCGLHSSGACGHGAAQTDGTRKIGRAHV